MPIEPQPQYVHQEYPKIIGYHPVTGRAYIARDAGHHEELAEQMAQDAAAADPGPDPEPEPEPVADPKKSHKKKPSAPPAE